LGGGNPFTSDDPCRYSPRPFWNPGSPRRDLSLDWEVLPSWAYGIIHEGEDKGFIGLTLRRTIRQPWGWRALFGGTFNDINLDLEGGGTGESLKLYWLGVDFDYTMPLPGNPWEIGFHAGPSVFYGNHFVDGSIKLGVNGGLHGAYLLSREWSLDGFVDWSTIFGEAKARGTDEINHMFALGLGIGYRF
jgi:hypothetical protein